MSARTVTDQLGNKLHLSLPVKRIISLVPSQTELLNDLGLDDEVIGITKFCIHPAKWKETKPKIGGTKKFDFDLIKQLRPDLIIGNKEENYLAGIQALQHSYPVWMSDVNNLKDAEAMIRSIGELTDKLNQSNKLIADIQSNFKRLAPKKPQRVLYLIWRNPWMAAGQSTFIHSMIETIGWVNCVTTNRYPELTREEIQKLNPEVVLLSSEPFPFNAIHVNEIKQLVPRANVILVDGEYFALYGSRLRLVPDYFNSW